MTPRAATSESALDHSLPRQRIVSIDAFRGLTILVMVFVNQLAGVSGVPQWARHMKADADAMSFVDVVFPAFLFIVGMSIPFALAQRQARGDDGAALQRHVLARSLGLIVLGLFMVNAEDGFNPAAMPFNIGWWSLGLYLCTLPDLGRVRQRGGGRRNRWRAVGALGLLVLSCTYRGGPDGRGWMTHQWWGILGLIGWSYLISASVYLAGRARLSMLLVATAACIAFYALCHAFPSATYPNWADLTDCGGLVCETSLTLLGVVTSLVFFGRPGERRRCGASARPARWSSRAAVAGALCGRRTRSPRSTRRPPGACTRRRSASRCSRRCTPWSTCAAARAGRAGSRRWRRNRWWPT